MSKLLVPALLGLYCVIAGTGKFLDPGMSGGVFVLWAAGYLLTAFTVAYRSYFHKEPFVFPFIVLAVILLNFFIQLTGGVHSPLWPGYFLLAIVVAIFSPLTRTLAATGLILVIEALNLFSAPAREPERIPLYIAFGVSLVGLPGVISHMIHRSRKEAEQARDRHERLIEHAEAVDPLGDRDTVEALTEENQLASNVKAARDLEKAFSGLIDMMYEFVPAHTYAVFLKERTGETDALVLRARRSDTDNVFLAAAGEQLTPDKDNGIIHSCIRSRKPCCVSEIPQPAGTLGYYARSLPVKSLLAIPIIQDGMTTGLLVVDSLEAGAFSLETQDMLSRFSPFFLQIIERIRVSQELVIRAATFAAMHEMSVVLNSTLELDGMLSRLARKINVLVPHDFCVFLEYDEKNRAFVVVHHSGTVALTTGDRSLVAKAVSALKPSKSEAGEAERSFPLEEGTLVYRMLQQWEKRQSSPYHFPDLGDRKTTGLFDRSTGLTRQLKSLSCWPLATGDHFIGIFILGSLRTQAFPEFHRNFLHVLSNQTALVMHNAILHGEIRKLARTDGLTGLLNHRTFIEKLREEYKRLGREERPFSVLIMDIDKFKRVNDTYGHPVGDLAIKAVAKVLKDTVRTTDFVARYGGEEFAVGMVDTDLKGALQTAERVRAIMEKTVVSRIGSEELRVTISIGVASFPEDTKNTADLVAMADKALYQAKRGGRNRVCRRKDVEAAEQQLRNPA